MSTAAQVLANRENSRNSTGPVSIDGKAASSLNSLRHGLTSKQIVIPGEDPAEYDALREGLLRDCSPAGDIERALVEDLAACSWRLMRARRVETAVLTKIIGDSPDPDAALAQSFLERPKELERLTRYITSIERAYWRALNKLEQVQKARVALEKKEAMKQVWLQNEKIGFVSQSAAPFPINPQNRDRKGAGSGAGSAPGSGAGH